MWGEVEEIWEDEPLVELRFFGSFECMLGWAGSPVAGVLAALCRFRGEPAALLDADDAVREEVRRRRLRGRSEESMGSVASAVDVAGLVGDGAVETGAEDGLLEGELAVGWSVAIGGVLTSL